MSNKGGATLAHRMLRCVFRIIPAMDIVHLIQSAVAPVFLLSGVGVTLGVLTNRLARIVDRARFLEAIPHAEARELNRQQQSLRVLARRAHYINIAIALCTVSALLVSLVVMSLFASAFISINLSAVIAILFVLAMICLTAAFGAFLLEVRLATRTLQFGVRH